MVRVGTLSQGVKKYAIELAGFSVREGTVRLGNR